MRAESECYFIRHKFLEMFLQFHFLFFWYWQLPKPFTSLTKSCVSEYLLSFWSRFSRLNLVEVSSSFEACSGQSAKKHTWHSYKKCGSCLRGDNILWIFNEKHLDKYLSVCWQLYVQWSLLELLCSQEWFHSRSFNKWESRIDKNWPITWLGN